MSDHRNLQKVFWEIVSFSGKQQLGILMLGLAVLLSLVIPGQVSGQNDDDDDVMVLTETEWDILAGFDYDWFANDNNTRSIALNPVTGHVLVASNTPDEFVQIPIIDAATGEVQGDVSVEGVVDEVGFLRINQLNVASNGHIYGANSVVDSAEEDFIIYRWEDEQADPEIIYQGSLDNNRYGDSFGLETDEDGNVILYFSGTGSDHIAKITHNPDENEVAEIEYLEIPVSLARGGIDTINGQDSLWVNGSGEESPVSKVSSQDGTVGTQLSGEVVTGFSYNVATATFDSEEGEVDLLAAAPRGNQAASQLLDLVDITDLQNAERIAETVQQNVNDNLNATGAPVMDIERNQIIFLATNNHIAAWSLGEITSAEDVTYTGAPEQYELRQNYPNPFNPSTTIAFSLEQPTEVTLEVFDVTGKVVEILIDETRNAGVHEVSFTATDLASGVYVYRLTAGGQVLQKQMTYIR